jgi:hypothetical protein
MSAKDRYSITLRCPHCGSTGTADLSENDHAYAPPETRVEAVRGGFRVLSQGGNVMTTKFACTLCGVEAE